MNPKSSAHPAMRVANTSSIANRNRVRDNNHAYLLNIVNSAKFVIGVSPLTPKHVEDQVVAPGEDALVKAAIEYLWKELNVRESEISESDIEKVFLPAKSNRADFTKLYIRFKSQEQANLCLYLAKSLTVPQNKISRYFPRQFNARVKTLGHVAHQLRNGEPKYKTSIEYTEDDIVLLVCPLDSFNYQPYFVDNLPAIDLRPPRSPPVGRKLKRTRSDSTSPPEKEKKKDRKISPVKVHANSNSNVQAEPNDNSEPLDDPEPNDGAVFVENGGGNEQPADDKNTDSAVSDLKLPAAPPSALSKDVGDFYNLQASSPLTGKVFFDLKNAIPNRRLSLNF